MRPNASILPRLAALLAAASVVACGPMYVQERDDGYYRADPNAAPAPVTPAPSAAPAPAPAPAPVAHVADASPADPRAAWAGLEGHGEWFWLPPLGWVWRPYAGATPGWRPYYAGSWEYTAWGWTWASAEPFGWAVYHYGWWNWTDRYGWVWQPGDVWAPAWVSWRVGGGCVGWAPRGPRGVVYAEPNYWIYVEQPNLGHHAVPEVVIHHDRAPNVHGTTTVIRDERPAQDGVTRYSPGPRAEDVQRWTQRPVNRRDINQMPTARPRDPAERRQPAPATVLRPEEPARRRMAPDDQSRPPMTRPAVRDRRPDAGMVRHPEEPVRRRDPPPGALVRRPEEPARRIGTPGGVDPAPRPDARPPTRRPDTTRPPATTPRPQPRPSPDARPPTRPPVRRPDATRPPPATRRPPTKVKGPSGPPPAVNDKRFTKPPGKVRPQPSARKRPEARKRPTVRRSPPTRVRRPADDDGRRR